MFIDGIFRRSSYHKSAHHPGQMASSHLDVHRSPADIPLHPPPSPTGVSRDDHNIICWPHAQDAKPLLFYCRGSISASWCESLKPPWLLRFISARPQISSCIIMMKSCAECRLLFITAFIQRPVYLKGRKLHPSVLQIKHECCPRLFMHRAFSISACSDVPDLSSPRRPAPLHNSGGHVGLYKPPAGPCSAVLTV